MTADKKSEIDRARVLYRQDDARTAILLLESADLANEPDALFLLGEIYESVSLTIDGVARNASKARKVWKKAAELGHAEAARELANCYHVGSSVKANPAKAQEYWLQAASSGDVLARFELANFYFDERPDKIQDAIDLYTLLILEDEFSGQSCLKLGRIFYRGIGTAKDTSQAIKWLTRGAEQNHANCCMDLAFIYFCGTDVPKNTGLAIELAERASKSDFLKDEALEVASLMRTGATLDQIRAAIF